MVLLDECSQMTEPTSLLPMARYADSKLFSLSLQPLTAFAELSYGRRDFAKTEGRKTEKGKVESVAEGEVGG